MADPFAGLPRNTKIASIGLIAGGAALLLYALTQDQGPPGETAPLGPGESWGFPTSPSFEEEGVIQVPIGQQIICNRPRVAYSGPASRNAFTQFQVWQKQGAHWVPVYASGVAGARLWQSSNMMLNDLVPVEQPEPTGCPSQALCAYPFPGLVNYQPLCGAPPVKGYAWARIAVYQRNESCLTCSPDFDGFSSTTCPQPDNLVRIPVRIKDYPDKILFI